MLNPELEKGDRVICLHMEDEWTSVPPGTKGIVKNKQEMFGDTQYSVEWENGSSLALLSSCDAWKLDKKRVDENFGHDEVFLRNIDVFKNFKMRYLHEFLKKVRECGAVNMFTAAPFLYMGKDRMEHMFAYQDIENEICDEVLDMANMAQHEMVSGVIKVLESEGKEVELSKINRYLQRYSQKVLENYMHLM
jgi:hypothetical protein